MLDPGRDRAREQLHHLFGQRIGRDVEVRGPALARVRRIDLPQREPRQIAHRTASEKRLLAGAAQGPQHAEHQLRHARAIELGQRKYRAGVHRDNLPDAQSWGFSPLRLRPRGEGD
jgi:hypothetical protein